MGKSINSQRLMGKSTKKMKCPFSRDKARFKEFFRELERRVKRQRKKALNIPEKTDHECFIDPPLEKYYQDMMNYANELPTLGLLPCWEKRIKTLLPEKLMLKYNETFNIELSQVKKFTYEKMHELGIKTVLNLNSPFYNSAIPDFFPDDDPKTTQNTKKCRNFFRTRQTLEKKLYMHHRIIRKIIFQAQEKFSKALCDFRTFRSYGFLTMSKLENLVRADIERGTILANSYYGEMTKFAVKPDSFRDILYLERTRFLQIASKIAAFEIAKFLMRSIEDFLQVLENKETFPLHDIDLVFRNKKLQTSPSLQKVFGVFHSFIDMTKKIVPKVKSMECFLKNSPKLSLLEIALNEMFLAKSHMRLGKILENAFQPLENYIQNVADKFNLECQPSREEKSDVTDSENMDFEFHIKKIQFFDDIKSEISEMSKNEYFDIGKLNQEKAKEKLREFATIEREKSIIELVTYHQNFNTQICRSFQDLETYVLNIPDDTKKLLDLGKYVLEEAQNTVQTLNNKIEESSNILIHLLLITMLTEDHIKQNSETMKWPEKIKNVFKENSLLFKQKRYELEEKMRNGIVKLNDKIEAFFPKLAIMDEMDDVNQIFEYNHFMIKFDIELQNLRKEAQRLQNEENLFEFPQTQFPRIKELEEIIKPFHDLIRLGLLWKRHFGVWLDGPFEYLDAKYIDEKTMDYLASFSKIEKTFKTKIKMHPHTFSTSVDDSAPVKLCRQLLEQVRWFQPFVPLATTFCNRALRQRHWDEMSKISGFDLTPDTGTSLRKMINLNLLRDFVQYEIISIGATKEFTLQESFRLIKNEWETLAFSTTSYKNENVDILTKVDDISTILEEHIVKVQTMRGSAFVKPIEEEVRAFYDLLFRIQSTINEWTKVQMQWIYLLPIFSSKDIVAQLPEEGTLFNEVDSIFRKTMFNVSRDPRVKETAGSPGLCEVMEKANQLMEKVNQGVSDYLERTRLSFPRFFFLSNDDMLEILSETKDPLRVQPHLKKCFEGISRLGFNENSEITSMFSDDMEQVNFRELVSTAEARGCVEKWLIQVEDQMIKSVKHEITASLADYKETNRVNWVRKWPGMVILCVSQIFWSSDVHYSLVAGTISSLERLYKKLKLQILDMVNLVKSKLSKQNRMTLNALVTIDVHAQDVVKLLIDKNVTSIMDFEWLAQLRYYWEDNVFVRIINATVSYRYEYLGNTPRLVITPLTDRCYRTLIGAYSLHLNGAPEGPAGTGKTETVKDLAKALAVQCVVFNCSEELDYKNMGKFFKGLASCGAWACFDEFNRIDLEVLSVIGSQILNIIQAVRANVTHFVFEGTELNLNPSVYICITMNPGYAGRSELPDNLKVLFRTVAMMVPDYAMIGEIFLYSSGFSFARELSLKIVTTYKLCSEQLSTQFHYDYGMRAVKTVLTAAQNMKFKYPDEDEKTLLLRAIIDVNLPKFLTHDVPLFQGIVSDLFPGVEIPVLDYEEFLEAVDKVTTRRNLQMVDGFRLKIIQTYEMMKVRHGFMLVGGPSGGKTTVLHVLAEVLSLLKESGSKLGNFTKLTTINPKAISMGRLYGHFDPISAEWIDGICAKVFRQYSMEENNDHKWLIFDGPVDAGWIENLNTVLDDNKKLCLASGEVMQMTNTMSMIFEVMDLVQASPATVSRCGMIYMEPQILGWRPIVTSWLEDKKTSWKTEAKDILRSILDWLIDPCLEFTRKQCHLTLNAGQINQVVSTLNSIEMHVTEAIQKDSDEWKQNIVFWFQAIVIMSVTWGIGGSLDYDSRILFEEYHRSLWKNKVTTHPVPLNVLESLIALPSDGSLHDNFYVFSGKGAWKNWKYMLESEELQETHNITQMMVPTIDSIKYQNLFLRHIKNGKRFLLHGETGTGKSFYIQNILISKLDQDQYLSNVITFTTTTTAAQVQELVLSKLFKKKGGQFGTMQEGTRCVVFVDDVNMASKEIYGAQPALEIFRQLFDHHHWYDLKEPEEIRISDIMFICAMAPPGGSRQVIYNRFLRHFNLYHISNFSSESILRIFSTVAMTNLKKNGFSDHLLSTVNNLVNATIAIYTNAVAELRPVPVKPHYLFNLRDFSRVILGCSIIKKESMKSNLTFVRLWVHEILRVFGDRLVDSRDHEWLFRRLKETTQSVFKESFDSVFDDLPKFGNELTDQSLQGLIFGTFVEAEVLAENRKYEEIASIEDFTKVANSYLEEYNFTHKNKMDIVLFNYALQHLARICRVLTISCGSLLMIGINGSGRQSLTRLAAYIMDYGLFQPEVGNTYGVPDWKEDIKKVLKISGGAGKDTVFLFSETQVKEEVFIEDIDSLLRSGQVPNLFDVEEKQEVIEMTRLAAQGGNRNSDISVMAVLDYFANRSKEKLHIMLCFSPIGELFRRRLRNYPSLVNCCTIDWFQVWPEDALEQVALKFTTDIDVTKDVKLSAIAACKYFHTCAKEMSRHFYETTGKKTYVTTAAFLDLICSFRDLMREKQEELILARDRYLNGLDKLDMAAEQIKAMKVTLSALRPELEKSAEMTNKTMIQIENENARVERATFMVKQDETEANKQAAISGALKAECEADLKEALPILEDALAALNILKPSDITLVKSMKNPPEGIKLVMAAICVMLDIPPNRLNDPRTGRKILDYWGPSKKILSDIKFLDYLRDYDKDNIPTNIINTIKNVYLSNKNFVPKIVAKASQAAEGLCKWVKAMVLYDKVAREIAPKREKLEKAQNSYENIMTLLKEKQEKLEELNTTLANLKENLQQTLDRKIDLENQVENCRNKLIRAEKLINGLGSEKHRWISSAENLQKSYECLPGDVLISCSMISYLAAFATKYRMENLEKWRLHVKNLNIPSSDEYNFVKTLGVDIEINSWYIYGLPRDSLSTENAIIMKNSKRCSLFVDPQSQANKWIRTMEKMNDLQVIKLIDVDYMEVIKHCIEYGKPLLIENVGEELDVSLDPILTKNIYKEGGITYITLGEKLIEYNEKFRMYITTKLRNPHYLPEIFNKVTLINFSLTIEGLEDQLLGIVVTKERPDLQEKKEQLIIERAANQKALKEVEDNILQTLVISGNAILDDEEAIKILNSSKILSTDILKKQKFSKETEEIIEDFHSGYMPIAKHSSALYYTLTDLPNVDPMYQFSLAWFINLYVVSIEMANKSPILEKRLTFLKNTFTFNLYQNVCRSLFEKDKILYSFVLYCTILLTNHELDRKEYDFFISGGITLGTVPKNPTSDWLVDKSWNEICRVECLPAFAGFSKSFTENSILWKRFCDKGEPQNAALPEPWESRLSSFQKLIVIRMIRPDKISLKIIQFVKSGLGSKFVTPPTFDISKSYEDSNCLIPLIFVLSAGSDPMSSLSKFAETMGYGDQFHSISLGQGQGPIAEHLIRQGQINGSWVCLQNCHLAVSWMPFLEKIYEKFDAANTSTNFRLWLTSYPSEEFPVSILQNGVKMTNEPPTGLGQNLIKSYTSEPVKNPEFFEGCSGKGTVFSKLLYALCFFHAVVQERRNYGPQGWNIQYGFNESDFQISAQQLQIFINDYDQVPFKAILYLTGECNYGGRVTDERDQRCLSTILQDFYNEEVINDPNYTFSNIGPEYNLPKKYDYRDYIQKIESIPLNQPPEVFGLHMNAGISRDLRISRVFFDSMMKIYGPGKTGENVKQDELLLAMKKEIYDKLPDLFDIEKAQKKYPVSYSESMNTVLVQEMERYNILLEEMKKSLTMLENAVRGLIVMTPDLEILSSYMLKGKIPQSWKKASSYPTLKPLYSFITDLLKRLNFLQDWFDRGKPPCFWISGFSFIHAFLTGATQNYARRHKISIDKIEFDFKVLSLEWSDNAPEDGVYVYGIYLDGARWDTQKLGLAESHPKVLWDLMPIMWFKPCESNKKTIGQRYECPLYITSARFGTLKTTGHSTNYVLSLLLDTQVPVNHWIKRGVALLCQLDN